MQYKMGVVGLGVMGGNLARNIESHGMPVAGYDLSAEKTRAFLEGPAKGKAIIAYAEALKNPKPETIAHAVEAVMAADPNGTDPELVEILKLIENHPQY